MQTQDWNTLKEEIQTKCVAYDYVDAADTTLSDFILNLLQLGKQATELNEELQQLVGFDYDSYLTQWIFTRIQELENPQPAQEAEPMDVVVQKPKPERQNRIFAQAISSVGSIRKSEPESPRSLPVPRRQFERSRSRSPIRQRRQREEPEQREDNVFSRLGGAQRRETPQTTSTRSSVFDRLGSARPQQYSERTHKDTQEEIQEHVQERTKERCKYWPSCRQGEQCTYFHPKTICPDFPRCSKPANECLFIHPETQSKPAVPLQHMAGAKMPIPCRFYPYCTNPVCPFMHPAPAPPAPSQRIPVPCNNGADCKRPDCHFTHPNDSTPETICKYDGVCTRPKCFYKHTIKTPVKPVHANMTLRANNDTPTNQRQFSVSEVTERIVLGESADLIKPPRPEDHDMDKDVVMDA